MNKMTLPGSRRPFGGTSYTPISKDGLATQHSRLSVKGSGTAVVISPESP